ncbi:MAG: cation transporter, partial [Planctomycetota bacterium]
MTRQALLHNKSIQKVTYVGMVVNIGLAILKIVFGLLVSSVSLVADGFHSLSDLATDAAVLVGVYFGSK